MIAGRLQYGGGLKQVRTVKVHRRGGLGFWRKWRDQNPKIVKFWDKLEQARVEAVVNSRRHVACSDGVLMKCVGRYLFMQLASGGRIVYRHPRI